MCHVPFVPFVPDFSVIELSELKKKKKKSFDFVCTLLRLDFENVGETRFVLCMLIVRTKRVTIHLVAVGWLCFSFTSPVDSSNDFHSLACVYITTYP